MMLGFKPGLYFRACWLFLTPATLLVTGVGGRGAGWGPGLRTGSLWAFSLVGLRGVGWAPGSGLLPSPEMPPAFVSVLGLVLSLGGKMNVAFSGLWALGWALRLSFLSRGVGIDHLSN